MARDITEHDVLAVSIRQLRSSGGAAPRTRRNSGEGATTMRQDNSKPTEPITSQLHLNAVVAGATCLGDRTDGECFVCRHGEASGLPPVAALRSELIEVTRAIAEISRGQRADTDSVEWGHHRLQETRIALENISAAESATDDTGFAVSAAQLDRRQILSLRVPSAVTHKLVEWPDLQPDADQHPPSWPGDAPCGVRTPVP